MSEHTLEGTEYTYTFKPLTGRDVIEHQKRIREAVDFVADVQCRIDDLIDQVRDGEGKFVDPYDLDWHTVVVPLAVASTRALLPIVDSGADSEKIED